MKLAQLGLLAIALVTSSCWPVGAEGEGPPSLSLELLSPRPGETRSSISWRVVRQNTYAAARVNVRSTGPMSPIIRWADTSTGAGVMEGVITMPATADTYEVWAELLLGDASQTTPVETEKVTVSINARPLVATVLSSTANSLTLLLTGENLLDESTLSNAQGKLIYARKPLTEGAEDGLGERAVSVQLTRMGSNRLLVTGELSGPGVLELDLTGVTNVYGTSPGTLKVGRPYFTPSENLGRALVSGTGIVPTFRNTRDGRFLMLTTNTLHALVNNGWTEVTTFNAEAGVLAANGDVYTSSSGGDVKHWNGTTWSNLPVPPSLPLRASGRLLLDAQDRLYLTVTNNDAGGLTQLFSWSGSDWLLLRTGTFSAHRFDQRVGVFEAGAFLRWDGMSFLSVPSPQAMLSSFSPTSVFSYDALFFDDAGGTFLLAAYEDPALPGNDVIARFGGAAVLRWNGAAWELFRSGNLYTQGWHEPAGMAFHMNLRRSDVRFAVVAPDGEPIVFTRDFINPGSRLDLDRLAISGYRMREGKWGPLPGAASPMLESEAPATPWEQIGLSWTPMAILSAAFERDGRLWMAKQVAPPGMPAGDFVQLGVH